MKTESTFEAFFEAKVPDLIAGGKADRKTLWDVLAKHKGKITAGQLENQYLAGLEEEMTDHTKNPRIAHEIVLDHLWGDHKQYADKVKKFSAKPKEKKK